MNQPLFQRVAIAISILLAALWYWHVRTQEPAVASVNGIYANECCGELLLQNGKIVSAKATVPFRLENMKFGLIAYPEARLEIRGAEVVLLPENEDAGLRFTKDGSAFSICGDARCDQEYVFRRR
jgi:hypothetical protein